MKVCNYCEGNITRVHRKCFGQYLISVWGIYPYSCKKCQRTTFRPQSGHLRAASLVTVLVLILVGASAYYGMRTYKRTIHRLQRVLAAQNSRPGGMVSTTPEKAATHSASALPRFLTNAEIIELCKARISDRALIDLIQRSRHDFQVDAKSLVILKDAGTSDQVIIVMVEAAILKQPGTVPPSPDRPAFLVAR